MQYKILALAAMAATAAAGVPHLAARQTDINPSACASALETIITDFPVVPDNIVSATDISVGTATDSCAISYPSSLSSAVSSFASEVSSWYSKNKDKVASLTSACPALGDNGISMDLQCASSFLAQQTTSGSSSATATSSSGSSASAAATTSSKGGAARETGAFMAAAAAVGVAVIAL
ncbi:unnamed protein product [Clonostachys rhizophaga]|uniref:DUF7735 domain-containing protein n=1 Tax=Clonostachys rhizophaga TaxID=160324 RepID=A0A9N9YF00_9HYPO|nr:unnamed protein product [Clonostachys rhizophaga]